MPLAALRDRGPRRPQSQLIAAECDMSLPHCLVAQLLVIEV
jgi:hypothetical protein